jgi:hypothetical protein
MSWGRLGGSNVGNAVALASSHHNKGQKAGECAPRLGAQHLASGLRAPASSKANVEDLLTKIDLRRRQPSLRDIQPKFGSN